MVSAPLVHTQQVGSKGKLTLRALTSGAVNLQQCLHESHAKHYFALLFTFAVLAQRGIRLPQRDLRTQIEELLLHLENASDIPANPFAFMHRYVELLCAPEDSAAVASLFCDFVAGHFHTHKVLEGSDARQRYALYPPPALIRAKDNST
jgi:hypothetical protein